MDITSNGSDTLYVTDAGNGRVLKISNLGDTPTIEDVVTGLNYPTGIEYYDSGSETYLFVSDTYNHRVRKLDTNGNLSTVAGKGVRGYAGYRLVSRGRVRSNGVEERGQAGDTHIQVLWLPTRVASGIAV